MLPYSRKAFESYIEGNEYHEIASSEVWYEERTDFSRAAVGTDRISHKEEHGFELLQGKDCFEGRLLGGCLESLYDILTTTRYEDEKAVCEKYGSENMAIIAVWRSICEHNNYQIIPSHPLDSDAPDLYSYGEGFKRVRWNILDDREHRDYKNAEIRKSCMAECVVKGCVPVSDFAYIYVYSERAKEKILKMENAVAIKDRIQVMPSMFPISR